MQPLPAYFIEEDPLAEPPLEEGPKIYKVGEGSIQLLEELDINPELPPDKQTQLEQVLTSNELAFGLDDRLGYLDAKVKIPLVPGTNPISLPPFPTSPVKRELMDKQMDESIQLVIIEPSKALGQPQFLLSTDTASQGW